MQKPAWFSGADLQVEAIPPAAYDLYNQRLDRFLGDYPNYLEQLQDYLNRARRTIDLSIWVLNQGNCPAKDIDIFMHFPDGFEVLRESELPKKPEPPTPPDKPKSLAESLSTATLIPNLRLFNSTVGLPNLNLPLPSANVQLLSIKRTKSYEVKLHVSETKHNFLTGLDPMYAVSDSHEHARSFSVEYKIYCGNAPERQSGKIHVIVER